MAPSAPLSDDSGFDCFTSNTNLGPYLSVWGLYGTCGSMPPNMFSILKPEADLAPSVKKKIIYLTIAMIPCSICTWLLLLASFLMNAPPAWGRWALPIALLLTMYLSGRIYSLRNPRQTSAHGI